MCDRKGLPRRGLIQVGLLSLIPLFLASAALRAGELLWEQTWDGWSVTIGPSVKRTTLPLLDSEVADDFDLVALIDRIYLQGENGTGSNPAVTGVYLRFYEYAQSGQPGALQAEYFLPDGDPDFQYDPVGLAWVDVTLANPFQAQGQHFVALVIETENQSFYRWSSNKDHPVGSAIWFRDNLAGGIWEPYEDIFGVQNLDVTMQLYGTLTGVPEIDSLSADSADRSARLRVYGSNFGQAQGTGSVRIDGLPAIVTRWSDTVITAYVPEESSLGEVAVQVLNGVGSSDPFPLVVTNRQPAGRLLWRFAVDADYMLSRPGLGPDGKIYIQDVEGMLYALSTSGGLLWAIDTLEGEQGLGEGSAAVGPDGTIYVGANPLGLDTYVVAVSPDGTILWRFTECCSQGLIAGPAVGPDGNIYAVSDLGGLGAFSLSPAGELLWNDTGNPEMWEYGQVGAEIVFGPSEPGGPLDQFYVAFDRQLDDYLWGFTLNGSQRFAAPTGPTMDPFNQFQAQPAVGEDGMVLLSEFNGVTGWGLQAFSPVNGNRVWRLDTENIISGMSPPDAGPDGAIYFAADLAKLFSLTQSGTERWVYAEPGIIDEGPVVSSRNDVVVYGGRPTFGVPGFIKALTTSGQEAWQIDLPSENGGSVVPDTRARFSADGITAYVGTVILGDPEEETYCYLYAVNAAIAFDLTLAQTDLVRGEQAIFAVSGAEPGETVYFLYSFAGTGDGPCPPQIGELCLDLLEPITVFGSAAAGPDGRAVLVRTVPRAAPLRDVSTQAVVRRGPGGTQSVKSNPVTAPILP